MNVLDLPEDILSIVFVLLEPKDFLALCCSSKVLYDNYQKDSVFWRTKTSTTFRTPISPLLKADGARWYHLYRRLKTQTKLYTWGQGLKGNLGHGIGIRHGPPGPPMLRGRRGGRVIVQPPRLVFQRTTSTWPTEAHVPDEVGVIADLQCGGWSTIIMSSAGTLYATGSINSANYINVGSQTDRFEKLEYLTQSSSAISEFSAGRTHILALTDDNEILSWDRINAKGLKVYSRDGGRFPGKPTRVVAGWGESSAYVPDVGIVYWLPLKNNQEDDMLDGRQVKEKVVPNTARTVSRDGKVYETTAHVILEGMMLYITSDSKIWACDIGHDNQEDTEPRSAPIQLPGFSDDEDQLKDVQGSFRNFVVFTSSGRVLAGNTDYVRRCFNAAHAARVAAAANSDDATNNSDPSTWDNVADLVSTRPRDVPALQHSGVIAVRFGDWHYQALHSNGKITSHGHEPESCGALGLGEAHHGGKLRGMYTGPQGMRQDSKLRPVADLRGRQVWFEPEKRDWLEHMQKAAEENFQQHRDQPYWLDILHHPVKQTVFSEWIEQEGRHWEDGPFTTNANLSGAVDKMKLKEGEVEDFHLDPYFALAIGAAGWHSGALVLVDEEKAFETRQKWIPHAPLNETEPTDKPGNENEPDMPLPGQFPQASDSEAHEEAPKPTWVTASFPRIKFPDGSESPLPPGMLEQQQTLGSALRPWRDGMPSMEELGIDQA